MERTNLTQFEEYPKEMLLYMRHYGPHFNRKLFEFAISNMEKITDGRRTKLNPYTKDEVESMLKLYNVKINNG